jgi:hypothetical protein
MMPGARLARVMLIAVAIVVVLGLVASAVGAPSF